MLHHPDFQDNIVVVNDTKEQNAQNLDVLENFFSLMDTQMPWTWCPLYKQGITFLMVKLLTTCSRLALKSLTKLWLLLQINKRKVPPGK